MYRLLLILVALFVLVSDAYALIIDSEHPIKTEIITNSSAKPGFRGGKKAHRKTIMLMNVQFTPQEREIFLSYQAKTPRPKFSREPHPLPSQWENGMNGVPVLYQGHHGTCVTFAVTAALDSIMGRGDYISQLCNLQLGKYLQKNSFRSSGWSGSSAQLILSQIKDYGYIAKNMEPQGFCNGITEYPSEKMEGLDKELTLEQFHQEAQRVRFADESKLGDFYWQPLLSDAQRLNTEYTLTADALVENSKKALLHHDHQGAAVSLVFAVGFPNYCHNAFCGKHTDTLDSWVLTKRMIEDKEQHAPQAELIGAHEMIITGYDDNAIAVDQEGGIHKGLFKIRNSWGTDVGDNGDFYMSYDFFKAYVIDVHKLVLQEAANKAL